MNHNTILLYFALLHLISCHSCNNPEFIQQLETHDTGTCIDIRLSSTYN